MPEGMLLEIKFVDVKLLGRALAAHPLLLPARAEMFMAGRLCFIRDCAMMFLQASNTHAILSVLSQPPANFVDGCSLGWDDLRPWYMLVVLVYEPLRMQVFGRLHKLRMDSSGIRRPKVTRGLCLSCRLAA
jgi:hypothetical protein